MHSRTRKLLSYYKPYLRLFLTDMFCAFIISAVTLTLPLIVRHITKNVLEANTPTALTEIYTMGAVMLTLVLVHVLCNMFVDYQGHLMGARMESDMRTELFDHYQKLSFSFYDEQKTGQLMTRLTTDIYWLAELFHHVPEDLFISLLKFAGAFAILLTINVELTVIVFLFLPLMTIHAIYFSRRMMKALRISRDRIGDINAQVEDSLAGIRMVKSFTNEDVESRKFAYANSRFVDSRGTAYKSEAFFSSGFVALPQLIIITVVVLGGIGILDGTLDLADLLTYLMFVSILVESVQRLSNFTWWIQDGVAGFNRFMEVLEVQPDIEDAPDAIELKHVRGHIQFRDVSFKYRQEHDYVLRNASLDIKVGEYVALVGSSGVGKTTLCSLIPRFYEVTEGEILLDGTNIRDVTQRSLRQHIGIVQQDVYLFAGTVAENIRYGKLDASDEEIVAAAKQANAHDFIMALPDGYDTDIGQRGVKLSGGQKQRLSIARVFLKNPPILIFDEATSSLDNQSERAIQESLERLAENRTTIVIAHRLSTVRNAQRIVVLTDCGIEEQGSHDELIAREGIYARLYNVQLEI